VALQKLFDTIRTFVGSGPVVEAAV
jgi:hypothetical protein